MKIIKLSPFILGLIYLSTISYGAEISLDKKIASMVILGFDSTEITKDTQIKKMIQNGLGGVILFDKDLKDRKSLKNIVSPEQLQALTRSLQKISTNKLRICIDQEGGKVSRLKLSRGFVEFPSAKEISDTNLSHADKVYSNMADTLYMNGINCNFGPIVDLSYSYNPIIAKLNRSYSASPQTVVKYATSFIKAHRKYEIDTAIKHFPGHGSSKSDSHKGFVDVTHTWNKKELIPFQKLIDNNEVAMIMTAHIYNKNIDTKHPATLSRKTITGLLRNQMNYKGIVISDDLQMSAISKNYTLEESIVLAINAGVDILLFGNQFGKDVTLTQVVSIVKENIENNKIQMSLIDTSYKRVIQNDI